MSGRPARHGKPALHAVVLAGGAGTRFWPLSREARPKPLLQVGAGRTLLSETLLRARRIAGPGRIWLICGAAHAAAMRRAAALPKQRVLVEPRMRSTAAAIALAAHRIARQDPQALMAVLPADHRIPDTAAFARAMRRAAAAAAGPGEPLIALGVRPTRPETGYGYIRLGPPLPGHAKLHRAARFIEKPNRARAQRYAARRDYLWNAGIFVWRARAILEELRQFAPAIARALAPIGRANARQLPAAIQRAYRRAPNASIDNAVLENSRRVACLPVEFAWSDLGAWLALAENLGVRPNQSRVLRGEALLHDAGGNLICGADRPIALLGVHGLAVIDAGDALLVASLERSDEVRAIITRLRKQRRRNLL